MVKHIIMLALCFMFYIIGNTIALEETERRAQFNKAVKCYRQFQANGLISRNIQKIGNVENDERDNIDKILESFYITATRKLNVGKDVRDVMFTNDSNFEYVISEFFDSFIPYHDFNKLVNHYKMELTRQREFDDPLDKFINNFIPQGHLDYYKSARKFSEAYRKGEILGTNGINLDIRYR